jgi:hypothetical protein
MAISVCLDGWHDLLCVLCLVVVGLQYMLYSKAESALLVVMFNQHIYNI